MVVIRRIAGGWSVRVVTPEESAATTVTYEQYDAMGRKAFDEAIAFLRNTIQEGY